MPIRTIDDILEEYNAIGEDSELEIRYRDISKETFKKLVESIPGSKRVEQSISAISNINKYNQLRREIYFSGKDKHEKYMKKSTIGFVYLQNGTKKITLSKEIFLDKPQKLSDIKHLRFKSRLSATIDDWRVDMTIVNSVDPNNSTKIKEIRQKMFNDPHPDKFLEQGPLDFADSFEVEIEYIGTSALSVSDVETIIEKVDSFIDPDIADKQEYQNKLYKVAKHIVKDPYLNNFKRNWGLKKLGNQPIELNRRLYAKEILPNITNYYITDKADGERCIVYISKEDSYILTADSFKKIDIHADLTILDAELVKNKIYWFDVLYFKNEKLYKKPFGERLGYFEKAGKLLKSHGEAKPMKKITKSLKEIKEMYSRARPYPIDGLMFTPEDAPYKSMQIYKWKPVDKLSADFLIIKPPARVMGIKPFLNKPKHQLYFLFCGIRYEYFRKLRLDKAPGYNEVIKHGTGNYIPIQFAPSDNPYSYLYYHPDSSAIKDLHYHIGEFIFKDEKWQLERMRPDKDVNIATGYYGNDYKVVDGIWQSLRNPLSLKDLTNNELTVGYFAREKLEFYKPIVGFNSFVKSRLIENFRDSDFIIDAASGQGQDLFRISNIDVKTALFIDIDENAIAELNSRKYQIKSEMKILTWVADLSRPAKLILEEYKNYNPPLQGADGLMINFAIHYIANTIPKLKNFINIAKGMLRIGGRVIITCFDGEQIFNLLNGLDRLQSWDVYEDTVLKYSIRKLYSSGTFSHGQKIEVKLPFTGDEYYEESLMDTNLIIEEFEKEGFEYEIFNPFGVYLSYFERVNSKLYSKLTEDDKKYTNLYSALTFYRSK